MAVTHDGLWLCSCSVDQSLKVYDVINFDMMNMCPTPPHENTLAVAACLRHVRSHLRSLICGVGRIKLTFTPTACEWIHRNGDAQLLIER